jgi:hypothetical protein
LRILRQVNRKRHSADGKATPSVETSSHPQDGRSISGFVTVNPTANVISRVDYSKRQIENVNEGTTPEQAKANTERVVKAATTFLDGGTIITLFETADRSSFLHETGHLFLESRRRMSLLDDVPHQVKDDWKTITKWLGVSDLDFSKPLKEPDAKRWHAAHEKWASGFERYLMEGKTPTPELKRAFDGFKEWFTDI